MSVKDIAKLGNLLAQFLALFAECFARREGRALLLVYVRGMLSNVQHKNVEAIALKQGVAPRTLRRFLESIAWHEQKLRDRCQQLVVVEHAVPEAIGCHGRCRGRPSGGGQLKTAFARRRKSSAWTTLSAAVGAASIVISKWRC